MVCFLTLAFGYKDGPTPLLHKIKCALCIGGCFVWSSTVGLESLQADGGGRIAQVTRDGVQANICSVRHEDDKTNLSRQEQPWGLSEPIQSKHKEGGSGRR